MHCGFVPEPEAIVRGDAAAVEGPGLAANLLIGVPPQLPSVLLAELASPGPLVALGPPFETLEPGLCVVGAAAATAHPRSTDPAAAGGVVKAGAILARLGPGGDVSDRLAKSEGYVSHGEGVASRVRLAEPKGSASDAPPEISIEGIATELADHFQAAFRSWCELRDEQL